MDRPRSRLPSLLLLAAVGALGLGAPPARAVDKPVIYKWVDENGVAHYTTDRSRIPAAIRDRVIQGGDAARGADWLRRDAGPPAATPAPSAPTAPIAREALDVEHPEDSDGVHAVQAQPDWSQAPGGEATWAPGDLGEDGQAPAQPALDTRSDAPPPPPPPPLETDGAPLAPIAPTVPAAADAPTAGSAIPRDAEPAPAPAPIVVEQEPARVPVEPAAVEPAAPAAVAAPAPRELAPDEEAELAALDARIAEVEAKIARDEEAMMELISATEGEAAPQGALVDDARFRDLAQRLPQLQADLERLRERRAQIQPVVPRP